MPATPDTPQPCDPSESDRKNDITADRPQERWTIGPTRSSGIMGNVALSVSGPYVKRPIEVVPAPSLTCLEQEIEYQRRMAAGLRDRVAELGAERDRFRRRWLRMGRQCSEIVKRAEAAERERDEAWAEAEQYSQDISHWQEVGRNLRKRVEAAEAANDRLRQDRQDVEANYAERFRWDRNHERDRAEAAEARAERLEGALKATNALASEVEHHRNIRRAIDRGEPTAYAPFSQVEKRIYAALDRYRSALDASEGT